MQTQTTTAGKTAITLVIIHDCHAKHNTVIENVSPAERASIEQLARKNGCHVAERKPKEPTCDNCGNMTIRQTRDGNHRYCDLLNQYIPDNEMFPSCSYHTAVAKFQNKFSGKARYANTMKKGGAK